ncbi:hypothetical protein CSV78_04115 [Sporosarcina sp. P16a]|uniref:O-antigen ligase family protein n=1 Tax=unclassified Sporosarcina TaxID=2647733 RepID=UPI000C16350C|nr:MULTISPECIES: O-antigen ligase family protein [unclassified Sporosarcina]PIC67985.1 hypothetical protein CSV78_04115 [Sporosarcina sp. P16a]PIC94294.1 hypothetical protein CSV70_00755 [Sporosarcina sp. P25]
MASRNVSVRNLFKFMYVFFLCFILFKPTPTNLLGDFLAVKLFDAIALIIILIILLIILINSSALQISYKSFNNKSIIILLIFAYLSLLSQFIASIVIGQPTVLNDLFELYRYIYYFLVFFVSYISGSLIKPAIIQKTFLIGGGGVVLIAILQYFNPLNIQVALSYIYTEEKLRGLGANNPRVFGSMYNANWFGLFAAIWTSYIFFLLQKSDISKRILWLVLLSYGIFGIYVSGSRTGFVLMVLGLIVTILLSLCKSFKIKNIIISFLVVFGIYNFIPFIREKSNRFNELFIAFGTGRFEGVSSFEGRISTLKNSLEYASINPLTGIGYGNFYNLLPHNSFLLLLIQFGIIGLTVISMYFAYNIFIITRKALKSSISNENVYLIALLTAIILNVGMLSGEYVNSIQLMSFYMLIVGYALGLNINFTKEQVQ